MSPVSHIAYAYKHIQKPDQSAINKYQFIKLQNTKQHQNPTLIPKTPKCKSLKTQFKQTKHTIKHPPNTQIVTD